MGGEIEKMLAVQSSSHTIGAFLEWAQHEQGISLMVWREESYEDDCQNGLLSQVPDWDHDGCTFCGGTKRVERTRQEWYSDGRSIERLLAEYFDVDLVKVEEEKQAALAMIRERSQ